MVWRKNVVSVVLWGIYVVFVLMECVGGGIWIINRLGYKNQYLFLVVVAVLVLTAFLLSLLIQFLVKKWPELTLSKMTRLVLESLLIVFLLAAGIALRVLNLAGAAEEASYYEAAMIAEGNILPQVVHGATYLYLQLLHGIFRIFGNRWIAGIWLQILLQMTACLCLYFGVRKMSGSIPAIIMMAFLLLLPERVMEGVTYSPKMLYLLLYSIGLLGVGIFIEKYSDSEKQRIRDYVYIVLLGLLLGFLGYLDINGFSLIPAAFSVWYVRKSGNGSRLPVGESLILLIGIIMGFLGSILGDAILSGKTVSGILGAWLSQYSSPDFSFAYLGNESGEYIIYLLICLLMMIGVFGYWNRKGYEKITPWVLLLAGCVVLKYFRVTADGMETGVILYWICTVLAGIAVAECCCRKPVLADIMDIVEPAPLAEPPEAVFLNQLPESGEIEDTPKPTEPSKSMRFIENPLPLPKKHVKKVMIFELEIAENQMHYDLDVADDDDFDI